MNDKHSKPVHSGSCLCGSVRYGIEGKLRDVVNCHCRQCQKTHGNYAAYTAAETAQINFIEDSGLKWFNSSGHARRGFCRECGASLFWQPTGKDYTCISAGTLDQPTGLTTTRNIFVADAGDYYHLDESLESFPGSMQSCRNRPEK